MQKLPGMHDLISVLDEDVRLLSLMSFLIGNMTKEHLERQEMLQSVEYFDELLNDLIIFIERL